MKKPNPVRRVVLDIETTGLSAASGDRVIEIAAVEVLGDRVSGKHIHSYINPERDINPFAVAIHGLTWEMLQDKPKFSEIAQEFVGFIRGAELIAHNAPFDIEFIDNELSLIGLGRIEEICPSVVDTLKMARKRRPDRSNTISALCAAYGIKSSKKPIHGALLDAYLLAEVYLKLVGRDAVLDREIGVGG